MVAAVIILFISRPAPALELKAGTAKTKITPADPKGRVLVMGYKCQGVMEDIYARALTIYDGEKRLVIVTYDLNCLDVATPILRVRCRDELGIDPANLLLHATHNHAAPIQIAPDNFAYGRWLADRIFELIKQAIANEQGPVELWFGAGAGPRLISVGGHPVDAEVQLLKVTRGADTVALFFNQASHPMQASFWRIEPGHPGYATAVLEKKLPGALAMYTDAAGGNQFQGLGVVMLAPKPAVKLLGQILANKVLAIASQKLTRVTGPISSRLEVIPLPLSPPMSYEDVKALVKKEKIPVDIGFVPYPHPDRESNWVRSLLKHYEENIPFPTDTGQRVCTDDGFLVQELPEPRDYPCVYEEAIVAAIGPLVLVAMQGEVCAPIGQRIKDEFRGRGPIMVNAYMGEHNLYIPTKNLIEQKAYQAQVIQTQYASPVPWSPAVEKIMGDEVIRMVNSTLESAGGD